MKTENLGFTLIELMIVVGIMGVVLLFSVPAIKGYGRSHDMKNAMRNIATQLELAREKAIATGQQQTMHFEAGYIGSDYHIHNGTVVDPRWSLPKGVTYYWGSGTKSEYRWTSDGRCLDAGTIILENPAGLRDTLSVRLSGLVLVY